MENYLMLMPALPLLGWLFNIAFAKRLREPTPGYVASALVLASFVLAVVGFFQVRGQEHAVHSVLHWDWLPFVASGGKAALQFGFMLDRLNSVMTLVITGIGFLIHVFAIGYMHGDKGFSRFFAYLNFFVGLMLVLVLADSLPVMFVGWEGVGVASFLLIGFWYEEKQNADAARKAFIVNRVGDAFFMLGMFLLFKQFGTLEYLGLHDAAVKTAFGVPAVELACVFLLLGAAGKSAQLPFSAWLPDAMAGPTPVSALIHAATMVTAGVYLVARLGFLYNIAPNASAFVAWAGALTALYGAISAIAQTDIKKILAYSTVSQLGYMFIAVGTGAYWAGIFHVVTHAFFKALLFLAAGSVIHAVSGEQDVRKMGGLRGMLPTTHLVSLVGTLAIAGIVPLAGFWSKDAILAAAFTTPFGGGEIGGYALWFIGLVVAVLTAFYMWRWYMLVFAGDYRGKAHPHESPAIMTMPLVVLAFLSVVGGFIGLPHVLGKNANVLENFLEPVAKTAQGFTEISSGSEFVLIGLALLAAVSGIFLASSWYRREGWQPVANVRGNLGAWSRKALFLDEIYNYFFALPARGTSEILETVDSQGIDKAGIGLGKFVAWAAEGLRPVQGGFVRAYAAGLFLAAVAFAALLFLRGAL